MAELLRRGAEDEIKIVPRDLAVLHKLILKRRPEVVLEFGVGFSTLTIAHALSLNAHGRLYSVDSSRHWMDNMRMKLGNLANLVTLVHSRVRAIEISNQLPSRYDVLPNIVPDFIYLDGPSPSDIEGNINGLSFECEDGTFRHQAAADLLLLESTLLTGAYRLVDRRYVNVQFLRNNLRRRWKVRWDRMQHQVGFELCDITGMSRTRIKESN